jgi:hypothetical protein
VGDSEPGSQGGDDLSEAGGGMGRPLHQQIRFDVDRQVTHVSLLESSGNASRRQVKPPVDAPPADATHDVSCGGLMSCLLSASTAWWLWWWCHV